jgi:glycosyltransferase involved in cell wall biosynthesis
VRLVLFAGRLVEAKGVRELLTAWGAIAREDSTARLAFVGSGALHEELARGAASMGFGDRVLLPGVQPLERVAAWMQACDVFCLPSHTEGYPNVLVEALACGRPVVATPVGGAVEIVDDSNGILTPVGDVQRLTSALQVALSRTWKEADLAARFSRSWNDVARETFQICTSVLSEAQISAPEAIRDRC